MELEACLGTASSGATGSMGYENGVKLYTSEIDAEDESEKQKILTQVSEVFKARLDGRASAYELRTAGFLANKLSQQAQSQIGKYAARVFAQAVATGHMRGHAIVAADYAIKVRNLQSPDDLQLAAKGKRRADRASLCFY